MPFETDIQWTITTTILLYLYLSFESEKIQVLNSKKIGKKFFTVEHKLGVLSFLSILRSKWIKKTRVVALTSAS